MILLQTVIELMNVLRSTFFFLYGASYHVGRLIFLGLISTCATIRDLFAALVIIGEEFYNFFCELNASINAFGKYMQSSANNSVEDVIKGVGIFLHHIAKFFSNTRMHSRLLASRVGRSVFALFALIRAALLLISDCICWLPYTVFSIAVGIGDGFVFYISAISEMLARAVITLVDDVFRLTLGVVALILIVRHRRNITFLMLKCFHNLKMVTCLIFVKIRIFWYNIINLRSARQFDAIANSVRTPNSMRASSEIRRRVNLGTPQRRSPNSADKDSHRCVICRDRNKSVLLLPCKHLCLCEECADYMDAALDEDRQYCPLCRGQIAYSISVYT